MESTQVDDTFDQTFARSMEKDKNWYEARLEGIVPERRGYHSHFVIDDVLYIYGGLDIREGSLSNMWAIDTGNFDDFDCQPEDQEKNCSWKMLETKVLKGQERPGAISHHTSVVFGDTMFLYGGSKASGEENKSLFSFDVQKLLWKTIQPIPGEDQFVATSRDEHTSCVYEGQMWVFGGFDSGMRQNSVISYDFVANKWSKITTKGKGPQPRAGHSAVIEDDKMYIFGGKDEDNEKQKDLWCLDLKTLEWVALECGEESVQSRSGHSACVYDGNMLIFAGIHEVTKELNDLAVYNFSSKKWVHMFNEPPTKRPPIQNPLDNQSPTKLNKSMNNHSPIRTALGSNKKGLTVKTESTEQKKKPIKKDDKKDDNTQQVELDSPTSVTLQNSFLIKNAGTVFDGYHKAMQAQRRKTMGQGGGQNNAAGGSFSATQPAGMQSSTLNQSNQLGATSAVGKLALERNLYGKVQDHRPAARDGHTGCVVNDRFIVFGGDRHQMPHNDMHFLNIKQQLEEGGLIAK